jgi:glycosyltransferase involved in cell wall biosynthesis
MIDVNPVLLVLIPGFPKDESDSTCLPAQQQLIRAINRIAPSLRIIVIPFQYPYCRQTYDWFGNQVIPLAGRNREKIYRLLTWMRAWQRLRLLQKQYRIKGILCCWYGECSFIGHRFARKFKIPCHSWLLGQDARPGNRFCRLRMPLPEELISVSDSISQSFYKNYGILPAYCIPNALLPEIFPDISLKKDIDFIGVGSLIPLKQFGIFIHIIKTLHSEFPDIRAVICGKGPEYDTLKDLIHKAGLDQHIRLSGELSYSETLSWLGRSKIMLHTSSYEGFSGACLEAIYAGVHVVSFCQPMNQPIDHWLKAADTSDMTCKARELLRNPGLSYTSILPFHMLDAADKLLSLYP